MKISNIKHMKKSRKISFIFCILVVFALIVFYIFKCSCFTISISNANIISKIFYNFTIPIAAIIGGIYSYYLFSKRHEEASLDLKINKIDQIKNVANENILRVNIFIENKGKRDVNLIYDEVEFSYYKVLNISPLQLELKNSIKDLNPIITNHRGKLRRGVNINIPFIISVNDFGMYFFEFKIKIDMNVFNAAIKKDEDRWIIWSDRIFYNVMPI